MRKSFLLAVCLAFGLFLNLTHCSPIKFSGSASMQTEYSSVSAGPREGEETAVRFFVNPTLTIFGMPINLNFFVSNEGSNFRQAMNKLGLTLFPQSLSPEFALNQLTLRISSFTFGRCNPYFSDLTLSGASVLGGYTELEFMPFYVSLALGQTKRAVEGSDSTEPTYSQMLYATRLGFGRRDGTHIHVSALFARDNPNSIEQYFKTVVVDSDTVSYEPVTPMENRVLGVDAAMSFFNGGVLLGAEVVGCEVTRDVRTPQLTISGVPRWVVDIVNPKISTSFDYALALRLSMNVFGASIDAKAKAVGPGFESFGTPYLRNDIIGYSLSINKGLFGSTALLGLTYEREHDNILKVSSSTTDYNCFGASLDLFVGSATTASISYQISDQHTSPTDEDAVNVMVNTSLMHTMSILGGENSASLSLMYQQNDEKRSSETIKDSYATLTLGNTVSFPSQVALSLSGQVVTVSSEEGPTYLGNVEFTHPIIKRWKNSYGLSFSSDWSGQRVTLDLSTIVPISRHLGIKLSAYNSFYNKSEDSSEGASEALIDDFNEFKFKASIQTNW